MFVHMKQEEKKGAWWIHFQALLERVWKDINLKIEKLYKEKG